MTSSTDTLARTKSLERMDVTLSGLAVEHLFTMAATDAEFWASFESNFFGLACTLKIETSVINLAQYKLFLAMTKIKKRFLE